VKTTANSDGSLRGADECGVGFFFAKLFQIEREEMQADDTLDHLLEASTKPATHRFWLVCILSVIFASVVGFVLLLYLDNTFACNTLSLRCPSCDIASGGTCRVGEVCGSVTSSRGLPLRNGCFSPHTVVECNVGSDSHAVCGKNMTCMANGRCEYSWECQPSDPSVLFPWHPPDFPPFLDGNAQVASFYTPTAPDSIYNRTVALLLRGPDQPQTQVLTGGCANADGQSDQNVWPECKAGDPVSIGYNRIGSATYLSPADETPHAVPSSYWPLSGSMSEAQSATTAPAPQTFQTVFGSQWAHENEQPYRYLLYQEPTETLPAKSLHTTPPTIPNTVFAAYNIYTATTPDKAPQPQLVAPEDLRNAGFNLDPSTTSVSFQYSNKFFRIVLTDDPGRSLQYRTKRPSDGPWVVTFRDVTNDGAYTDEFCWTTVDDTPTLPGTGITAAPFPRVVLAVPMSGTAPEPSQYAHLPSDKCLALTWTTLYPGVDEQDLDAGQAARVGIDQPNNHDYTSVYAVPAISSSTVKQTTDEPQLWGTLTGDYQIQGGRDAAGTGWQPDVNVPYAANPSLCTGTHGCPNTCDGSSEATRDNCARDMNWISWCEWRQVARHGTRETSG
jgi:hypothetical protein